MTDFKLGSATYLQIGKNLPQQGRDLLKFAVQAQNPIAFGLIDST